MFTGIVESVATIAEIAVSGDGARITVRHPLAHDVGIGDSVAINGTCLTVVDLHDETLGFDVVNESLSRTNLGCLVSGSRVNLERAMPATGRFDGHIVQGHVDGTVTVRTVESEGDGVRAWFDTPPHLMRYVVEKGSVALDGASLTVAGVDDAGFAVTLIPHTIAITTFGDMEVGRVLNLETDVLAKYVERLVDERRRG